MDEETMIQIHVEISKIKKLENNFGNEIFDDFEKIFKTAFLKFNLNSEEFKIIDEILNFPNLKADQSKLDLIFLINLHKLDLGISIKIFKFLKEIEERQRVECTKNLFDLRHIDNSKIIQNLEKLLKIFKKKMKN
ncbi:hypothetical protein PVAND_015201 [Polypedilum vanderplanki]|uniref:Uncharacterized protein n=1 Tax=Polypedilum vanderplanki TaxID=319348 RepID=A0A9J6BBY7_POLVA|nr:hypothetical protein PVAND_015201 [Polypedilum vanderplanki]